LDELKLLWEVGIYVQDVRQSTFRFRAILLWTIHDLLAYGIVASCTIKGYQGCPCCAFTIIGQWSNALQKIVYCGQHRRWLLHSHPYCQDVRTFVGIEEVTPPTKSDMDDVYVATITREAWLQSGRRSQADLATQTGIKRLSALF
jgi:hypothetical protein